MTLASFFVAWAVVSVVSALAMGRWLGERALIDQFVAPLLFRVDED